MENALSIHKHSTLLGESLGDAYDVGAHFLVFESKTRGSKMNFLKTVTVISAIQVILFAGKIDLKEIDEPTNALLHDHPHVQLNIDSWVKMLTKKSHSDLLSQLRARFSLIMNEFLINHLSFDFNEKVLNILNTLYMVIQEEDHVERAMKVKNEALQKNKQDFDKYFADFHSKPGTDWNHQ